MPAPPVSDPRSSFVRYGPQHASNSASEMDFNILIMSIETYASSHTTENTQHLRCECTEPAMTVREQEMVITSNLVPQTPFSQRQLVVPNRVTENENTEAGARRAVVSLQIVPGPSGTAERASESPPPEPILDDPVAVARRVRLPHMPLPSSLAFHVANRIINYARGIKYEQENDVSCPNCGCFPVCPVTGQCGHTRCTKCIEDKGKCPCGIDPPESLYVNVLIRDLIRKATLERSSFRIKSLACSSLATGDHPTASTTTLVNNARLGRVKVMQCGRGPIRHKRATRTPVSSPDNNCNHHIPMTPWARYNHALRLLEARRYCEAAPYLALAAASYEPDMRSPRILLAQVITILSKDRDPRHLNRQLNRSVRQLVSKTWIKLTDMECILCFDTFKNPVTTPCGHMFCRTCLERTLDYGNRCPLCLRPLHNFNLNATRETVFIQAALAAINASSVPPPLDPEFIPIFVCTVAYPSVPCPLFIFDPRYWLMIRRVLESGSRKFGMVASGERNGRYVDFGTILEVRDCVQFEDGRSILSTVGVSRFKVIERDVRDGCEVARIRQINDAHPVDIREVLELRMMGTQVMLKALIWLMQLKSEVLEDIETTFGRLPKENFEEDWWISSDGPAWLWWLVAVLPLRSEIKVLILATNCLIKRMMAVSRTLDTLQRGETQTTRPTTSV